MLSLEKKELEPDIVELEPDVVERLLSLFTSLPAKHSSTIPLNSLNLIVLLAVVSNSSNSFVISSLESCTPIADRAFPNLDLNAQPSEAEALVLRKTVFVFGKYGTSPRGTQTIGLQRARASDLSNLPPMGSAESNAFLIALSSSCPCSPANNVCSALSASSRILSISLSAPEELPERLPERLPDRLLERLERRLVGRGPFSRIGLAGCSDWAGGPRFADRGEHPKESMVPFATKCTARHPQSHLEMKPVLHVVLPPVATLAFLPQPVSSSPLPLFARRPQPAVLQLTRVHAGCERDAACAPPASAKKQWRRGRADEMAHLCPPFQWSG
jgi:hypothetical protein